ncbi:MAG: hypothetical protein K5989_01560 [Lachnospiraceae bacterium]|nr:hypothetical protein [Lachnospiraceae bacterium]
MRRVRIYDYFLKFINILYFLLFGWTFFLVLFFAGGTDYYLKKEFLLSNPKLFLIGVLITAVFAIPLYRFRKALEGFLEKRTKILFPLVVLLLFAIQCLFVISGFFYSDWDPAGVLGGVFHILRGDYEAVSVDYFSAHPNNLLLVWIYLAVMKAASLFGTESVLVLGIFQCILYSACGILIFRIARTLLDSYLGAYLTWLVFAGFIGLSPWLLITYSDSVGLIFPLAVLRLFQLREGKNPIIIWALMGILTAIGYALKPQTVIAVIAVLLLTAFKALAGRRDETRAESRRLPKGTLSIKRMPEKQAEVVGTAESRRFPKGALSFLAALLVTKLIISFILIPSLHMDLDPNKPFGMAHYFMMGLNQETNGVYSNEDTNLTNSIGDPEERTRFDMDLAGERLRSMGIKGLLSHLTKKTLVNFADGTFAWGIDGNFFAGTSLGDFPPVRENALRPYVMEWIHTEGRHYGKFSSMQQIVWLMVLFLSLFSVFGPRNRGRNGELRGSDPLSPAVPSGGSESRGGNGGLRGSRPLSAPSGGSEREGGNGELRGSRPLSPSAPFGGSESRGRNGELRGPETLAVLALSLIGLHLFELLFEAKARYIFIGTPFFLLLSAAGVKRILSEISGNKGDLEKESVDGTDSASSSAETGNNVVQ